ncbi:MAG TPA: adenylate kinase [Candidatus Melainabacteria bacterium]|nr:adenylate kinase [Candidatus Melainabacteria bacterium]
MQLLFLGAPGAGKGTQCKMLAKEKGLCHLSSGDLLREAVKQGTEDGVKAKSYMDQGNLVPDEVLIDMFEEKLSKPELKKGFILDGFPRNLDQAASLDALLDKLDSGLTSVINLETSNEILEERITGRRDCPNKECNAVFHTKFAPPQKEGVCDNCQTELVHRSDDKPEVVKKRLSVYAEQTEPLIKYYKDKGLVVTLDGEAEPKEVFQSLLNTLNSTCVK